MEENEIWTKDYVAKRYHLSKATIDTAVSRSPDSIPPFFRMGKGRNAPVRFRKADCLRWEQERVNHCNGGRSVKVKNANRRESIDFDALIQS